MGGIMMPITMSTGIERARLANREDEKFEMEKQTHGLKLKGLEMDQQRDAFEFEQAQKDAPLKDLERKAKTTAELAKHGFVMLSLNQKNPKTKVNIPEEWGQAPQIPEDWGYVTDENAPHVAAKVLTDSPIFGKVTVLPNGWLSDGESVFQATSRQDYIDLMYGMAFPEKAMELARREQQYINEKGKVETMTAGEAKSRGLEMATDKLTGYAMNKARIEDQFAEEKAGLDISKTRAEIGKLNAEGRKAQMEGLGYDFSDQNAGAIEDDAYDAYLADMGYQFSAVMDPLTMSPIKQWTKNGKPAEISPEDHAAAREYATATSGLLATGQAVNVPHARALAREFSPAPAPQPETITGADGKEYVQARQGESGARKAKDGNWYKPAAPESRGLEFEEPPGIMSRMLGNANVSGVMPQVQADAKGKPAVMSTARVRQADSLAQRLLDSGEAASLPEAKDLAMRKMEEFNRLNQAFADQTGATADQDPEGFKAFVQQSMSQAAEVNPPQVVNLGGGQRTPPKDYPDARWAQNPQTGAYGWFVKRNGKNYQVKEK